MMVVRVSAVIVAGIGMVTLTAAAAWGLSGAMTIDDAERWGRLVASIGVPSIIAGYVLVKVNESVTKLVGAVNDLRAAVVSMTAFVKARG